MTVERVLASMERVLVSMKGLVVLVVVVVVVLVVVVVVEVVVVAAAVGCAVFPLYSLGPVDVAVSNPCILLLEWSTPPF